MAAKSGTRAESFRRNDIDAEVLSSLTADDLIGLAVASVGHRRKLLDAIPLQAGASSGTAAGPASQPRATPKEDRAPGRRLNVRCRGRRELRVREQGDQV